MEEPIACVIVGCGIVYGDFEGAVPMSEDEVVGGGVLEVFVYVVHHGGFVFVELFLFGGVGLAAFVGAGAGDSEGPSWRQCPVKCDVEPAVEDPFDEEVAFVAFVQSVAVPNQTAFPVDDERGGLAEDPHSEFFREIVLHPHVVVSRKVVKFNVFFLQFR